MGDDVKSPVCPRCYGPTCNNGLGQLICAAAGRTDCGGRRLHATVVDIRFAKHDTYIGRAGDGESGYFGNPFKLKAESQRGAVLEQFKVYFFQRLERDKFFKARVLALRGHRLGCFCHPQPCHGDVIASYLNAYFGDV